MLIKRPKPQICILFSIFRAVYLDTQVKSTNFLWFSGIIRAISRGYLSKVGLIFVFRSSWGSRDAHNASKTSDLPIL